MLWRTGVSVLRVEARLPIDLALQRVKKRELPGDLFIHAEADSVNLALMEAFTPNVRKVSGLLRTDVEVNGTWEAPRLKGFLEVINGAATLPSLGVRYGYMNGRFNFLGDSITVETFRTTSGEGELQPERVASSCTPDSPELNLGSRPNFLAINSPTFLTLEASGNGTLRDRLRCDVTGDMVANSGVLHFADLLQADRESFRPGPAGSGGYHVDPDPGAGRRLRERLPRLAPYRDLRLTVRTSSGSGPSDANVQLEGSVLANKSARISFRRNFHGAAWHLYPAYRLRRPGLPGRPGTVRYFGTPDLNAELDSRRRTWCRPRGGYSDRCEDHRYAAAAQALAGKHHSAGAHRIRAGVLLMFGRPSPEFPGVGAPTRVSASGAGDRSGLSWKRALQRNPAHPCFRHRDSIDFFEIRSGAGNLFHCGHQSGYRRLAAGRQNIPDGQCGFLPEFQ